LPQDKECLAEKKCEKEYQPSANGLFALKSQSIASMAELEAENRKITE